MQQEKTFVPGMDNNPSQSFYTRRTSFNGGRGVNGTMVPGMQDVAPSVVEEKKSSHSNEAVVGFLYSVSRQGIGEYWPLHLGSNIIGRSANCDIRLRETTVSTKHASLFIKKMKTTDQLIATIRDEGSKNGIFVNEEELDYNGHDLKNGDIVTIGSNYKLLTILINAKELGLSVSESFEADNSDVEENIIDDDNFTTPVQDNTQGIYSRRGQHYDGTVDLSGANSFDMGGATKILP